MKYGSAYSKLSKYNPMRIIESQPFILSAKSFLKLIARKKREHFQLNYPLLVISGMQRSGTHLLDNLLRNHHQILSYYGELQIGYPNKYFWPDLKNETNLSRRFRSLIPQNMVKHLFNTNFHHNFVFDFLYFRRLFIQLEKQNENFNQRQTLNNFFTAYFNSYLSCNHSNFYDAYKFIAVTIPGLTTIQNSMNSFFNDYPEGKIFVLIRNPFFWWNSARNHSKRLEKYGLNRYRISLENTKWACDQYKKNVFAVSFDHLVDNTEISMSEILKCAGLEFNKTASYPSNFPYYAVDNSTFGHKKSRAVSKEKIKRKLNLSDSDKKIIQEEIFPLYREVLEGHAINFSE